MQIPVSEIASPAGEGKFLRDDGKEIPTEIATETYKAIEEFKEACEDAGKPDDPESIGDFLQAEFEHWLEHEKPGDNIIGPDGVQQKQSKSGHIVF